MKEENQEYVYDFYAQKLSDIAGVPLNYLLQLRDMGLLNQRAARNLMIKYDYKTLRQDPLIPKNIAINRIATLYNFSTTLVSDVLRTSFRKPRYCKRCGKPIQHGKFNEQNGLCDICASKEIKI